MESSKFNTVAELNKQYEILRNDILVRHNIADGSKVRLKNAIFMYQKLNGVFIKVTSTKSDMVDRVKMYSELRDTEFMLISKV